MSEFWYTVWILLLIVGYLYFWFFIAKNASAIAADKGYEKRKWFWICFLFELIGLILIAAMPNQKLVKQQNEIIELLRKVASRDGSQEQPSEKNTVHSPLQEPIDKAFSSCGGTNGSPIHQEEENHMYEAVRVDRSQDTMVCPRCGEKQRSNRNLCQKCAVKFRS